MVGRPDAVIGVNMGKGKNIDCSAISSAEWAANYGDRSDCMETSVSSVQLKYIREMEQAQYNLNEAIARGNLSGGDRRSLMRIYQKARKSSDKEGRRAHRSLRKCLGQDPRSVCFRQKSMQTFWTQLPKTMDKVAKIFDSGFNASSKAKAIDEMNKAGMSAEEQALVLAAYNPNASTNTGSWGGGGSAEFGHLRMGGGSSGNGAYASAQIPILPLAVGGVVLLLILKR